MCIRDRIKAAKVCNDYGCAMAIVNGSKENVLVDLLNGQDVGTYFNGDVGRKLSAREHWIMYRSMPKGKIIVEMCIRDSSYTVPAIFDLIAKNGNISEDMMYNTFNMGLGMVIALDPKDVDKAMAAIKEAGDECYVVGHVEAGDKGVKLC